ncbi:ankyrin repeat domain-containing protein 50-like isoform X2 [Schistocerca gregaria]|uniref:ankyrin repeat domain-containing protein 50-like isoform X2 n=1 Tax=Schistocerca gregaria TaxID=7010 RepID=UPI00211DA63F|nr:ankyrin repeat domain-containing protein 50-like isoform X2 [Schistocerca gregaria]
MSSPEGNTAAAVAAAAAGTAPGGGVGDAPPAGGSKRFFCREWAFAKLAHSLEQHQRASAGGKGAGSGGTVIVGGPGTGKTALCRELVWPRAGPSGRQQRALRRRLLAFHFCQAADEATLAPANFVRALVAQLLARSQPPPPAPADAATSPSSPHLPKAFGATADGYAEKVRTDPEIVAALRPESVERDPDEALKRAVLFPLLELEPPRHALFLLVDSIDEAQTSSAGGSSLASGGGGGSNSSSARRGSAGGGPSRTVAELLAATHHLFPHWLALVCTARRHSRAVARLFAGFRRIALDDLRKSQVVRDVQQYILARLDQEDALRQHISRDTAEMLNQLHIKSNGCFLYLEKVLDGVAENFIVLREVREIPGTLNGLYLWLCQRLFSRKQFAKVQPLLNAMLAARRPLSHDALFRCVRVHNCQITREDFARRLHLLRRVLAQGGSSGNPPQLFHHSFAEWLLDVKHCTQKYLCSAAAGHGMLAVSLSQFGRQLPVEEVPSLAMHMVRSQWPPPQPQPAQGQALPAGLDPHTVLVLWLIDSGAPVEDCLLEVDDGDYTTANAWRTLPLPKDNRVLRLLADAGARVPTEEQVHSDAALSTALDISTLAIIDSTEDVALSSQISVDGNASPLRPISPVDPLLELLGADGDVNRADSGGRTLLHALAAEGDAALLALAAARPGACLEATDRHGQTPLNLAARHGHAAVVAALLAAGARADHADCDGWTALRAAAWGGHTQVVEALLAHGAAVDCADSDQRTALRAAAWGGHEDIVLALLRHGADVNRTDDEGRTALIAAAYMGHSEIVEHLLDFGAEINHEDADGRTALSVAALCVPANEGYVKVVNILLERGAAVDHQDKDGMTPLLVAAFEGHRDVCELLLEYEADVDHADRAGRTPLWAASSMGHSSVVELLLFWGCYVDSIDPEGRTVLSVAAAQGGTDVVRQLLDRGLDEQHRDNSGWTPLHYAAFEGHKDVCEALLEAGARVDEADNDGKGPLLLAAQEGHSLLVEMLLSEHAAPPDQRAHDGKTALRLAAVEGHSDVVISLLAHGADVNVLDADGRSTLYVLALENRLAMARLLLEEGNADVETRDSEGRTPLHVSAWQGHAEMVALLLTVGGADVDATDNENRTALHSASWQGHAAIVQLLLEHGARPDHTCNQGATALGIAAQEGHEGCVRALLEHGADPNHSDRCGRNALRVAAKSGHEGVVRLLEEFSLSHRTSQARSTSGGGSSSATSLTSGSTAETKPSSAVLCPPGPGPCRSCSPVESPDSGKRRSFVSLGNNSSNSKSSSNFTGSTKSSQRSQEPGTAGGTSTASTALGAPSTPMQHPQHQAVLSFTQQLQQCSRGTRTRPLSRLLSPLQSEPQSPIYASPPHSPLSDVAVPSSPLALNPAALAPQHQQLPLQQQQTGLHKGGLLTTTASLMADSHFARDTHMRIILGNSSSTEGRGPPGLLSPQVASECTNSKFGGGTASPMADSQSDTHMRIILGKSSSTEGRGPPGLLSPQVASECTNSKFGGGNASLMADPHFARDTHMRIILGNSASAVGRGPPGLLSSQGASEYTNANSGGGGLLKPRRNGIVTNPALRIVAGVKNGLDAAAGRKHTTAASRLQQPKNNGFQWRKETPL